MEKLSRQVSDSFETPSNLCAVVPRFRSNIVDGVAYFEFVSSTFAPVIRVEWPADSEVALVDKDVADAMVKNKWARHLTNEEADAYNAAVDAYIASTQAPVVEPVDPFAAFGVASPAKPDVVSSPGKPAAESKTRR